MDYGEEEEPAEEDDDFKTMKESDMRDEEADMYDEGQILMENLYLYNDSQCQFTEEHCNHVYCVANLPQAPFNTFISGDGDDKCFVWTVRPKVPKPEGEKDEEVDKEEEAKKFECVKIGELEGHTETLEFIKFNHDGKLVFTGGMNNVIRVWQVQPNDDPLNKHAEFKLKCMLDKGPDPKDDILFA
mmetsp:Transcript_12909/g.20002  ORF Transcript_12909/g.20002 Transcript_12909/m.20002 type:complete len:186 (+) Transcript_12909:143-700(+)